MKRLARILPLAALVCAAPGVHALDDTPLSMVYEPPATTTAPTPNTQKQAPVSPLSRLDGCRLAVRNLEDLRPSKESAGAMIVMLEGQAQAVPMFARSVHSGDGTKWLKGAVGSLRRVGLQVPTRPPAEGVDVALRLAQSWTGGMNMHAHVVLQASYPGEGGERTVRRYHGFATKVNGWSANDEFMATLNMAMQDALVKFAGDLQHACKGEAL
jgi:hypothetical protein